jgi:hypothetical protein
MQRIPYHCDLVVAHEHRSVTDAIELYQPGHRSARCRAFAQAPPPLSWVVYAQGKAGKTTEWLNLTLKHDAPMYDKEVAAGVVRW